MSDFVVENGVLIEYKGKESKAVIPEGVKSIKSFTFCMCESIEEVIIPDSVTDMGDCAFYNCPNLVSVQLPRHITVIGTDTFSECTKLKSIRLPESVQQIEMLTFGSCIALKTVTFGKKTFSVDFSGINLESQFQIGIALKMVFDRDFELNFGIDNYFNVNFASHLNDVLKNTVAVNFYRGTSDKKAEKYIKNNIYEVMTSLIYNNDTENIKYLIETGKFITKKNIDKITDYAIQRKKSEIYLLFVRYKSSHIGFETSANQFKF